MNKNEKETFSQVTEIFGCKIHCLILIYHIVLPMEKMKIFFSSLYLNKSMF